MKKRGFTLLEILIVCAVIGSTIFLAFSALDRHFDHICLETKAEKSCSALRYAKEKARASGQISTVTIGDKLFKFSSSGYPLPGYSGTAVITSKFFSKKIILSSVGRIRLE